MVQEGRTVLAVAEDDGRASAGPATRDRDRAFYNPAMRVNRDLSVLLVDAFARGRGRPVDVADVLAGAGARSLRLAHEVPGDITVHANDGDPNAVAAVAAGMAENGVPEGRLDIRQGGAHAMLAGRRFDVVDVDPYGSPAPFTDAAVRATRHRGLVCLTATDTAALCGRYPRVCRRRYGAWHGLHAHPWRAEVGLRILHGAVVRAAARHERGATPVLSVAQGHWMRVVCRIEDGRGRADAAWKGLADAVPDARGAAAFVGRAPDGPHRAGPLWTGALHEAGLLDSMAERAPGHALAAPTRALLHALRAEADAPPFWTQAGDLASRLGTDAPRQETFRRALSAAGFAVAPTHMDPRGTRTDAPWEDVQRAWFAAKVV